MVGVGGRGGASGGRGRLRLRALNGLVSLSSTPCYVLTRCGGLKRLPPLPPTSGTRGMDAWMLGCLSLCSPSCRCGPNLGCFLEAFGHLWCHLGWSLQACGSIWARLAQAGYPNEQFGTPVQAGAPIWGDLLDAAARVLASCGGLCHESAAPLR